MTIDDVMLLMDVEDMEDGTVTVHATIHPKDQTFRRGRPGVTVYLPLEVMQECTPMQIEALVKERVKLDLDEVFHR